MLVITNPHIKDGVCLVACDIGHKESSHQEWASPYDMYSLHYKIFRERMPEAFLPETGVILYSKKAANVGSFFYLALLQQFL